MQAITDEYIVWGIVNRFWCVDGLLVIGYICFCVWMADLFMYMGHVRIQRARHGWWKVCSAFHLVFVVFVDLWLMGIFLS